MTIAFTGGGTGGHFYPIIAVVEALRDLVREKRLIEPKLYYIAPTPFDVQALFENGIEYLPVPAGKIRRYASFRNFLDIFVTGWGVLVAWVKLFRIYPDVLVSKGGYASVPSVVAAWLLRIPIVIHESDARPGRANLFAARFATYIAISFDSAAALFPKNVQSKIARTGIPIRKALQRVEPDGAAQYLDLDRSLPTILILGGSSGAERINTMILTALPTLLAGAQVIHQTGRALYNEVVALSRVTLEGSPQAKRYHPVDFLSEVSLQRAAGVASVIVSRAGATAIAEIGLWRRPAILIPIPESISHDQRSNAYAYARTGAATVLEEANLTPHLLAAEVERIVKDPETQARMSHAAAGFTDPDAARILASQVLSMGLAHES